MILFPWCQWFIFLIGLINYPAEYCINIYSWLKVNFMILSNFSCLQIIISLPPTIPLQKKKTQTEVCWKRWDSLKVKLSHRRRTARTVLFARMGLWTGCSYHADTPACVMAAWSIFSSAQCAGSLFRNLLHFAVKKSKIKTNRRFFEDIVTLKSTLSTKDAEIDDLGIHYNMESTVWAGNCFYTAIGPKLWGGWPHLTSRDSARNGLQLNKQSPELTSRSIKVVGGLRNHK